MANIICFLNLDISELFLIFLIILILFGSSKLPDLAKSIGESIKEFKKAREEEKEKKEVKEEITK